MTQVKCINICMKDLYKDVYNSIICKIQNRKEPKCPATEEINCGMFIQ